MRKKVVILDFGSQYTQLIARRVRELGVFCEIYPYHSFPVDSDDIQSVILSGSPLSVNTEPGIKADISQYYGQFPILGICFGAQLIAKSLGGRVENSNSREYGKTQLDILNKQDPLFNGILDKSVIWMSHADSIMSIPEHFETIAATPSIPIAAFKDIPSDDAPVYCLQFHPEVTHTAFGLKFISNFLFEISGCEVNWNPGSFIEETVDNCRRTLQDEKVVLGLSGGVDSSVAAFLLNKAIGKNLHCIFVDNGLLRHGEFESVLTSYQGLGLNIKGVDATNEFIDALQGKENPEEKRKAVGKTFIDVFEREAKGIKGVKWLGQGTIYPDIIESVSVHGPSVTIKSHHNVGALPERLQLKLIEPLKMLFKDEVRKVGKSLNIPAQILNRHPFPGPGLSIRVLGEVTPEKLKMCRAADDIFISELRSSGWYDKVWQSGTILVNAKSVGVMGDERTYEYVIALRSVDSNDGMTANWSPLPHDLLSKVSNKIINNVQGINRVVYDISTKPPATIEWE